MPTQYEFTNERKRELCEHVVTLDGRPAVIGGTALRFARVTRLDDSTTFEWSWEAAERIIQAGGGFRS